MPDHDGSLEDFGPPTGRCQCLCACHNGGHGIEGCRNPTNDQRVLIDYRPYACFECLIDCDG